MPRRRARSRTRREGGAPRRCGFRTLIHRSHATAIVCSTVSDEKRAASWNERPRPCSARPAGPVDVTSRPFEPHDARVRVQVAGDQVEERGLARTVRADDAEHLVAVEVDAHVVDGAVAAEGDRRAQTVESNGAVVRSIDRVPGSSSTLPGSPPFACAASSRFAAPSMNTDRIMSGRFEQLRRSGLGIGSVPAP